MISLQEYCGGEEFFVSTVIHHKLVKFVFEFWLYTLFVVSGVV